MLSHANAGTASFRGTPWSMRTLPGLGGSSERESNQKICQNISE